MFLALLHQNNFTLLRLFFQGRDPPLSPTDLKPALSPGRDNKNINAVNQGSYMDAFKKQKTKQVDYKAYTLKDYRNINKEVRLTGLGPDVDSETLRERVSTIEPV